MSAAALKVVFAGTPEFAVPCLEALIGCKDVKVVGVMSQPDRRSGRGMRLTPSPVKRVALEHGIEVVTPERLRDNDDALDWLQARKPDFLVVVAFGMILPERILAIPRIAPVNVHASLLPRWRGAAPIERALLAGDAETGVCIMRMEAGLDTGGVYACRSVSIGPQTTGGELRQTLSELGAGLLLETLPRIAAGLKAVPQDEKCVSYAHKIQSHERLIDWHAPAMVVDRVVRCFAPAPGARTRLRQRWLKVLEGEVLDRSAPHAQPGTWLGGDSLDIACGEGSVYRICRLQPEGRKPMAAADFLRGAGLGKGEVFGT